MHRSFDEYGLRGAGGGQPLKHLMFFCQQDELHNGFMEENALCDQPRWNMQKKAKRGNQTNSSHCKLLNLHLSCGLRDRAHWSGNNLFPDEHILFQANLTVEAWLLPFIINIFKNCLLRYIF